MSTRQQGNELGKKEMSDFNSDARVGKPWTSQTKQSSLDHFRKSVQEEMAAK
jgi:hypothetical protein